MNRIRKNWKNNGTPFYFYFNTGHERIYLDSFMTSQYDKVVVDDKGLTAMDTLVDIRHVLKSLAHVDDTLLKTSVIEALSSVYDNLKSIVSLNLKM